MPNFGRKSQEIKSTINPMLALLCDNVVKYFDITLIQGRRGKTEQNNLFADKLSQLQWPDSKHNADEFAQYPDDLSMAVDVAPWPIPFKWGDLKSRKVVARDLQWKERVKFYQMVAIFKYEWARIQDNNLSARNYELRFGADWDSDNDYRDQSFDDLPHIELEKVN